MKAEWFHLSVSDLIFQCLKARRPLLDCLYLLLVDPVALFAWLCVQFTCMEVMALEKIIWGGSRRPQGRVFTNVPRMLSADDNLGLSRSLDVPWCT